VLVLVPDGRRASPRTLLAGGRGPLGCQALVVVVVLNIMSVIYVGNVGNVGNAVVGNIT
jgi:hypothetical protein